MKKYSVKIAGHATSISLEEPFWKALKELADEKKMPMQQLVTEVDASRNNKNLSSALRIFILEELQKKLTALP